MSSAVGSKHRAQNSVMRECSERGNILAALSNNSLLQTETSFPGISSTDQETALKGTSRDHFVTQETPVRAISTHQCYQSCAEMHEENEAKRSSTSFHGDADLAAEEMEESPKDDASPNIPPLADDETASSDLFSYSARSGAVDESEGLVKTESIDLR